MKIVIVRHGDPDYTRDTLTDAGWKEAELVSDRVSRMNVAQFYVSPLGRAKDTASYTLRKTGREAIVLPWLQEFCPRILRPDLDGKRSIAWDWLPQDWTTVPAFYDYDHWADHPVMREARVKEEYDRVTEGFRQLLSEWGYERDGNVFRVTRSNNDTIVLFAHYGVTCVLISWLAHVSPMILWHSFCTLTTSVTTIVSEERRQGIASFRVVSMGDLSHFYAADVEPSFSARFCEAYENGNERHD